MCKDALGPALGIMGGEVDATTAAELQSPGTPKQLEDQARCSANRAIFFARVPPLVPEDALHALFSRFGAVEHLNLFRRWATAKSSKGCGVVRFATAEQAAAAMRALDGASPFPEFPATEGPMVVEWCDPSRLSSPPAPKATKSRSRSKSARGMPDAGKPGLAQRAAPAPAGAGAGGVFSSHPAVEALDVCGIGMLDCFSSWGSLDAGCDPSGGRVPVHVLPMISAQWAAAGPASACNNAPSGLGSSQPSPLAMLLSPAGAVAPGGGGLGSATTVTGPLGCGTPSLEPWACGPASQSQACSISCTSQQLSAALLCALPAGQQPGAAEQGLLLLEDPWAPDSSDSAFFAAAGCLPGVSGELIGGLGLLGAGAGAQQPGLLGAAQLYGDCLAGQCGAHDGYLSMQPAGAAGAAAPAAAGLLQAACAGVEPQRQSIALLLCDEARCSMAAHMPHVAGVSGAELQLSVGAAGLQLRLEGTPAQLDSALRLIQLLVPGAACGVVA